DGPVVLLLGLEGCKVAVTVRVKQTETGKVAFNPELFGRGGEQQQTLGFAAESFHHLILTAGRSFGPFKVMRLIDYEDIPAGGQRLGRATRVSGQKIYAG